MEIPKIEKIVVNMGLGEAKDNPKAVQVAVAELAMITGQAPVITKAKNQLRTSNLEKECQLVQK